MNSLFAAIVVILLSGLASMIGNKSKRSGQNRSAGSKSDRTERLDAEKTVGELLKVPSGNAGKILKDALESERANLPSGNAGELLKNALESERANLPSGNAGELLKNALESERAKVAPGAANRAPSGKSRRVPRPTAETPDHREGAAGPAAVRAKIAADPAVPSGSLPPSGQGESPVDAEGCVGGSLGEHTEEGESRAEHEAHLRRAAVQRARPARETQPRWSAADMRKAVVMAEILDKPKALRLRNV